MSLRKIAILAPQEFDNYYLTMEFLSNVLGEEHFILMTGGSDNLDSIIKSYGRYFAMPTKTGMEQKDLLDADIIILIKKIGKAAQTLPDDKEIHIFEYKESEEKE